MSFDPHNFRITRPLYPKNINVEKNNIVQMRPLTAEIKNNNLNFEQQCLGDKKNISRGNIHKIKIGEK